MFQMLQKYADTNTVTRPGVWLETFGAPNLLGWCQETSYYSIRGSLGLLSKRIGISGIYDLLSQSEADVKGEYQYAWLHGLEVTYPMLKNNPLITL